MPEVKRCVALAGLLVLIAACTTSRSEEPPRIYVLDQNTKQLEGWFSAGGGDWTLYPIARIEDYERFDRKEDEKCVPMVNGTGRPRSEFASFEGKKVVVEGHTIAYEDLPVGPDNHDQILYKRYYNGELLMNYCYRKIVFVVERIERVSPQ